MEQIKEEYETGWVLPSNGKKISISPGGSSPILTTILNAIDSVEVPPIRTPFESMIYGGKSPLMLLAAEVITNPLHRLRWRVEPSEPRESENEVLAATFYITMPSQFYIDRARKSIEQGEFDVIPNGSIDGLLARIGKNILDYSSLYDLNPKEVIQRDKGKNFVDLIAKTPKVYALKNKNIDRVTLKLDGHYRR